MTPNPQLRGQHSIKLFVSTELKGRLTTISRDLGRPLADVTRTLIWMGLPILEGLENAHLRGSRWWIRNVSSGKDVPPIEETV